MNEATITHGSREQPAGAYQGASAPAGPAHQEINVGEVERAASALGGGALLLLGLSRRSLPGLLLAAAGGGLLYRGVTGHCAAYERLGHSTADSAEVDVSIDESVTVQRAPGEIYQFLRDPQNYPRFMRHVRQVRSDGTRSHWQMDAPLGSQLEWDAELAEQRDNEALVWRSVTGSAVSYEGALRLVPAPGSRGTEVHFTLRYRAPGGPVAAALIRLLGRVPQFEMKGDLLHLKQLLEAGEIPTTEGQPQGER